MITPPDPKVVKDVAARHGLAELFSARFAWVALLHKYQRAGYPAIVWSEAIQADYVMIPLLDAALHYKLQRQLPAH